MPFQVSLDEPNALGSRWMKSERLIEYGRGLKLREKPSRIFISRVAGEDPPRRAVVLNRVRGTGVLVESSGELTQLVSLPNQTDRALEESEEEELRS